MRLFTDTKEIYSTYNRKVWAANWRLKKQLELFELWDNVRKNKKQVVEKYSNKRYDKNCMRIAKGIVKKRDKICQRCGSKKELHCSHIINDWIDTRMSVDPDNMKLLCKACHLYWWHKRPKEAMERFEEKRPWRRSMLEERAKNHDKWTISNEWREQTHEKLLKW
jgi:5-methylcytosine-specific restriction endonuclease McrA